MASKNGVDDTDTPLLVNLNMFETTNPNQTPLDTETATSKIPNTQQGIDQQQQDRKVETGSVRVVLENYQDQESQMNGNGAFGNQQWQQPTSMYAPIKILAGEIDKLKQIIEKQQEEIDILRETVNHLALNAAPTMPVQVVKPMVGTSSMRYGTRNQPTVMTEEQGALGAYRWMTSFLTRKVREINYADDDDNEQAAPKGVWRSQSLKHDIRPNSSARAGPSGVRTGSTFQRKAVKGPEVINGIEDIAPLGKLEKLSSKQEKFKLVEAYVMNSHNVDESWGQVKIHGIHQFKTSGEVRKTASSRSGPTTVATASRGRGNVKGKSEAKCMLLWYKTTPDSLKRLAQKRDGCVAFYDRLARAFSVVPEDLEEPLRQVILLCSVSLGNGTTSPHGYRHWSKKDIPPGYDSIRGLGRITTDWSGKKDDDGVTVPLGMTKEGDKKKKYELEYSEYIIFEARRIQVRYAVDLEVIPMAGEEDSD